MSRDPEKYTYYSNLSWPLNSYKVEELYDSCDQDYTAVDGSMYFLPRDPSDVVLNQGIVSENLLGMIEVHFPIPYDIKGLTVEFGKAYPVDFSIISDNSSVEITGNQNGHFVTEKIFSGATFLRFVPAQMVNGQMSFPDTQITMGTVFILIIRKSFLRLRKNGSARSWKIFHLLISVSPLIIKIVRMTLKTKKVP